MDSVIKVYKIQLRRSVRFAEWAHHTCYTIRYVYNRAVSEYLFSGTYIDRVVVDTPTVQYAPRVSDHTMLYGMYKQLTEWRAELKWVRELPVSFGRGAIQDASVACRGGYA